MKIIININNFVVAYHFYMLIRDRFNIKYNYYQIVITIKICKFNLMFMINIQ